MYGSSQGVIGDGLKKIGDANVFSADKVWISSGARGPAQIEASRKYLGRAEVRPPAGAQPARLGGASAHAVRHEGGRAGALCRHHDLGRPPPRRLREDHARASARLRAGQLQHPRPRGGEPHPAARARARHRGDHQPAVPRGRSGQDHHAQAAAAFRGRDRRDELGAADPEVHHLAPGGDLRDPGDDAGRSRAGERRARRATRCPMPRCARASWRMSRSCEPAMSEWWTYSLTSFLLFSPRTYYRLFELYNADVWPLQIVALALGLAILVPDLARAGVERPRRRRDPCRRAGCSSPGPICWSATTRINWAARYFAIGFALQAALLAWTGIVRDRLRFDLRRRRPPGRPRAGRLRARDPSADRAAHRPAHGPRPRSSASRPTRPRRDPRRAARRRPAALAPAGDPAALVRDQRTDALDDGTPEAPARYPCWLAWRRSLPRGRLCRIGETSSHGGATPPPMVNRALNLPPPMVANRIRRGVSRRMILVHERHRTRAIPAPDRRHALAVRAAGRAFGRREARQAADQHRGRRAAAPGSALRRTGARRASSRISAAIRPIPAPKASAARSPAGSAGATSLPARSIR